MKHQWFVMLIIEESQLENLIPSLSVFLSPSTLAVTPMSYIMCIYCTLNINVMREELFVQQVICC